MFSRPHRFARPALTALPLLTTLASVALLSTLALLPGRAEAQQDARETIELDVGDQTTLDARNVERYSEGAPGIVDVRVPSDGRQFIIVGLRAGTTSLLLIYPGGRQTRYTIRVRDPNATPTVDPGSVPARENIRLDLYFVQLTESYSHQIGLGFPGTIGGRGVGNLSATFNFVDLSFNNATASVVNQVLPRLDLAQTQGWARLRRQAMLVTTNGTAARYSGGGEINVLVQGALTAEIRSIEFGSEIRVTPRYDSSSGRIELELRADVSDLTEARVGNIPGRTRTLLQTVVNLEPGQAIVLGGLNARTEAESQGGLPGLSQIPIVGVLFGTNNRSGEASQSLLFIVPTVVQSVPRNRRDYISETLDIYRHFEGYIHDIELIETSPPGYQ